MGTAEWVAVGLAVVGFFVGIIAFFLKGVSDDQKENKKLVIEHDKSIALLNEKVPEHGARLLAIEGTLAKLTGDVRELMDHMRTVRRWVDMQTSPDRHRRATDRQEPGSGKYPVGGAS